MARPISEIEKGVEENAKRLAPWLGGYFEAGGSLGFGLNSVTNEGRTYTYGYPFISTSDQNPIVASTFKELFGGTRSLSSHGYPSWRADRTRAGVIASTFVDYAPSRKEFMTALKNWANSDKEERVRIAQEMRGFDRISDVSVEEYEELVARPDFLAGIVDSRGTFNTQQNKDKENVYSRLNVYTTNRPLLEALKQQYGGYIGITGSAGDTAIIAGRTTILKRDKVYWTPSVNKTADLFDFSLPHLMFKAERGRVVLALRT